MIALVFWTSALGSLQAAPSSVKSDACVAYDQILKGDPNNESDLDKLELWLSQYPLDDVTYQMLAGSGISWYWDFPSESKVLEKRADMVSSGTLYVARRMLLLAWYIEQLRVWNPSRPEITARKQLLQKRQKLFAELGPMVAGTSHSLLVNGLQLKTDLSDTIDAFLLNKGMRVSELIKRMDSLIDSYEKQTSHPIARMWFEEQRCISKGSPAAINVMLLGVHERPEDIRFDTERILLDSIRVSCETSGIMRTACPEAPDICFSLKLNLLGHYKTSKGEENAIKLGNELLEQYPQIHPKWRAEVLWRIAYCQWKLAMFPEARDLFNQAAELDPTNKQATDGVRRLRDPQYRDGGQSGYKHYKYKRGERMPW